MDGTNHAAAQKAVRENRELHNTTPRCRRHTTRYRKARSARQTTRRTPKVCIPSPIPSVSTARCCARSSAVRPVRQCMDRLAGKQCGVDADPITPASGKRARHARRRDGHRRCALSRPFHPSARRAAAHGRLRKAHGAPEGEYRYRSRAPILNQPFLISEMMRVSPADVGWFFFALARKRSHLFDLLCFDVPLHDPRSPPLMSEEAG